MPWLHQLGKQCNHLVFLFKGLFVHNRSDHLVIIAIKFFAQGLIFGFALDILQCLVLKVPGRFRVVDITPLFVVGIGREIQQPVLVAQWKSHRTVEGEQGDSVLLGTAGEIGNGDTQCPTDLLDERTTRNQFLSDHLPAKIAMVKRGNQLISRKIFHVH